VACHSPQTTARRTRNSPQQIAIERWRGDFVPLLKV
jgi:hypothetical protein